MDGGPGILVLTIGVFFYSRYADSKSPLFSIISDGSGDELIVFKGKPLPHSFS